MSLHMFSFQRILVSLLLITLIRGFEHPVEHIETTIEAMSHHRNPALAADAGVIKKEGNSLQVLLVERGNNPFKGKLAFPGGFVDYGEDPKDAAIRELEEETKLIGKSAKLVGVYGKPNRDPRQHVVSIFYYIEADNFQDLKGSDDAADAKFYNMDEILKNPSILAFDHEYLLKDFVEFLKKEGIIGSDKSNL